MVNGVEDGVTGWVSWYPVVAVVYVCSIRIVPQHGVMFVKDKLVVMTLGKLHMNGVRVDWPCVVTLKVAWSLGLPV